MLYTVGEDTSQKMDIKATPTLVARSLVCAENDAFAFKLRFLSLKSEFLVFALSGRLFHSKQQLTLVLPYMYD